MALESPELEHQIYFSLINTETAVVPLNYVSIADCTRSLCVWVKPVYKENFMFLSS